MLAVLTIGQYYLWPILPIGQYYLWPILPIGQYYLWPILIGQFGIGQFCFGQYWPLPSVPVSAVAPYLSLSLSVSTFCFLGAKSSVLLTSQSTIVQPALSMDLSTQI